MRMTSFCLLGNTLPLIARPWSFNTWTPVSDNSGGGWFFDPNDATFYGIRCTHQPSPWISDYGEFRIAGSLVDPSHDGVTQYTAYNSRKSEWHPYYFKTDLLAYGNSNGIASVEMTSTSHGSIIHYNFPKYEPNAGFDQTRKILVALSGGSDHSSVTKLSDGTVAITGYTKSNSGGVQSNFAHYFVIGLYSGDGSTPITSYLSSNASAGSAWIDFDATDPSTEDITLRIATSFISLDQALTTYNNEVNTKYSFKEIMTQSKSEWSKVLNRIEIGDAPPASSYETDKLVTFYSALYRASLFPRQLSEVDANGNTIHWSAYDPQGGIYDGPITTDSGFWDAYSTVCKYYTSILYFTK